MRDTDGRGGTLLVAAALGAFALAAVAAMLLIGLRAGPGAGERVAVSASSPRRGLDRASRAAAARLFAPTSFWNAPVPANAAVDPASPTLVSNLADEVSRERQSGIGPWIDTVRTTSLYRVGAAQPRVRVHVDTTGVPGARALRRAFAKVPIPRGARPADGPDRHMTIWQPATDTLWELFAARRGSDGWHARWGGAIRRVSRSLGYYTRAAWPGATRNWGATASSLPVIGGTIMVRELRAGRIDHALSLNLPAPRARQFAWPAQRTDGLGPPDALPEGARLRLDPALDVRALHLPRLTRMIAEAAQRYGLVVRDQTRHAMTLFMENPARMRKNPYPGYYGDRNPAELLAEFPWDRLQVLRMRLCSSAPCRAH